MYLEYILLQIRLMVTLWELMIQGASEICIKYSTGLFLKQT